MARYTSVSQITCRVGKVITLGSVALFLLWTDTMAQVRPQPMGNPDSNIDIMLGREWAAYFIGGFCLLVFLLVMRSNQQRKKKEKELARKHRRQMEKLKGERLQAAQKPKPQD